MLGFLFLLYLFRHLLPDFYVLRTRVARGVSECGPAARRHGSDMVPVHGLQEYGSRRGGIYVSYVSDLVIITFPPIPPPSNQNYAAIKLPHPLILIYSSSQDKVHKQCSICKCPLGPSPGPTIFPVSKLPESSFIAGFSCTTLDAPHVENRNTWVVQADALVPQFPSRTRAWLPQYRRLMSWSRWGQSNVGLENGTRMRRQRRTAVFGPWILLETVNNIAK